MLAFRVVALAAMTGFATISCGSDPDPPHGPAGSLITPNPSDTHRGTITIGTGGSSSGPRCTGSASPCSLHGSDCASTRGCVSTATCSGVAPSCYSQYSSYTCTSVSGCYWSYSTNSCSGVADSCYSLGEFSCSTQTGCYLNYGCSGVPTPCSLLSVAECSLQLGCRVQQ